MGGVAQSITAARRPRGILFRFPASAARRWPATRTRDPRPEVLDDARRDGFHRERALTEGVRGSGQRPAHSLYPAIEPRPAQLDQPGFALDARDLSVAHSPSPLRLALKTSLGRDDSGMATGGRRCPGGAHRSGEGRGARRREIDLKAVRWTMPAPGMTAGREVAVPLSTGALEVLEPARAPSSDSSLVSQSRTGAMLPRNAPGCVLRPAGVMQASGVCSLGNLRASKGRTPALSGIDLRLWRLWSLVQAARRLPQRVHHSRPRSNQRSYGCCEGYITAQRIRMTHFRLVPRQTHPRQRHRVHPGAQFGEWLERWPTGRSAAWSPNATDPGRHLRVPNTS